MAGSRERFLYVTDSGDSISLVLDESNGRATVVGGGRITNDLTAGAFSKPIGFTPRYVNCYLVTNPLIKRRFVVGNPAAITSLTDSGAQLSAAVYANADDTAPAPATWNITSYRGEKLTVVPAIGAPDTGLQEATA